MSDPTYRLHLDIEEVMPAGIFSGARPTPTLVVKRNELTREQLIDLVEFHLSQFEVVTEDEGETVEGNTDEATPAEDCCNEESPHLGIGKVHEAGIFGPSMKTMVTEEFVYDNTQLIKKITTTEGTVGYSG